jgi:hypothetical protein
VIAIVLRGVRLPPSGIRARIYLLSVAERERKGKFIMLPRRERKSPDPEDREVRRRGRPTGNPEMERQMRDL